MEIIINNQQAVLKEGTSFDFIAENRLFTGSDSYTLTITFPLRGCVQNIAIFGHIHRADVAKNKVCPIAKFAIVTFIGVAPSPLRKFLMWKSKRNFWRDAVSKTLMRHSMIFI